MAETCGNCGSYDPINNKEGKCRVVSPRSGWQSLSIDRVHPEEECVFGLEPRKHPHTYTPFFTAFRRRCAS